MNIRQTLALAMLFAAGFGLTACKNQVANFTALSTHQIPLAVEQRGRIEVDSTRHILLIFPIGEEPNLGELIDEAVERRGGDMLMDVKIDFKSFYIPFIYGVDHYEVDGEVVSTR